MATLIDHLDLELAWKRVSLDLKGRVFIHYSQERQAIQNNTPKWLSYLSERLKSGSYDPSECVICDVPKSGGAIRPGAWLSPEDVLIYTACVSSIFQ